MLHNQHVEMCLLGKARPICATERVRVTADSRVELATRTRGRWSVCRCKLALSVYRGAFLNMTASLAARQNAHVTSLCSRFPVHRRRTSDPSSSQQQHSSWVATWLEYLMCPRVHLDHVQAEVRWHVLTRPEELELACPMHVAEGHGPIVDIPGQLLHWQLLRQCSHQAAAHHVMLDCPVSDMDWAP